MSAPKPVLARDFLALVRPPSFFSRSLVKASGCARSASPLPPRRRCRVVLTATGPAQEAGEAFASGPYKYMESASGTPAQVPTTASSASRQSRTGQVASARVRPGRGLLCASVSVELRGNAPARAVALSGREDAPQSEQRILHVFKKLPGIVPRRAEEKPASLQAWDPKRGQRDRYPSLLNPYCPCQLPSPVPLDFPRLLA